MRRGLARKNVEAIEAFLRALVELAALSDLREEHYGSRPHLVPKPGREQDWYTARLNVDRVVAAAAHAVQAAGGRVEYKPRGTFATRPVNPVVAWSTVLSEDPMFGLDIVESVCHQAIGFYNAGLPTASSHHGRTQRLSNPWLVTIVGGTIAAVVAAYLIVRFGIGR